jgi:hypothetical protein
MSFFSRFSWPGQDRGSRQRARAARAKREDTDTGWGEYTEPDDDERLRRDRPPHWDDY